MRKALLVGVGAVGLVLGGSAPALAGGWFDVDADFVIPGINPCTGVETQIAVHVEEGHFVGPSDALKGETYRGTYTAADGASGTFRNIFRARPNAGGDGGSFSQVILFVGEYEGRRQTSTFVAHGVIRDGVEKVFFTQERSGCTPG
jgi:hypothetical protein